MESSIVCGKHMNGMEFGDYTEALWWHASSWWSIAECTSASTPESKSKSRNNTSVISQFLSFSATVSPSPPVWSATRWTQSGEEWWWVRVKKYALPAHFSAWSICTKNEVSDPFLVAWVPIFYEEWLEQVCWPFTTCFRWSFLARSTKQAIADL